MSTQLQSQPRHVHNDLSSIEKTSDSFTRGRVEASKNVEWYQPTLEKLSNTSIQVFKDYAGIPEDRIVDHIYQVRDKAWDIFPYPCIGVFRFLDFGAHLNPIYPEVLSRVRAGDILLDLGCCFGQDIRKFVADGAPSENLIGLDTEERFFELGYELFKDKEALKTSFYAQSIFEDDILPQWQGKIDVIYLGSFLHLFNFEQQRTVVAQLVKLLRKRPGSMVFGRNLGADQGGEFRMKSLGWDLYRHSQETINKLWEEAPEGKWTVDAQLTRYASNSWEDGRRGWQGEEIKQMNFVATRL